MTHERVEPSPESALSTLRCIKLDGSRSIWPRRWLDTAIRNARFSIQTKLRSLVPLASDPLSGARPLGFEWVDPLTPARANAH